MPPTDNSTASNDSAKARALVEQVDRDAAVDFRGLEMNASWGIPSLEKAFARHRIAAEQQQAARIAELEGALMGLRQAASDVLTGISVHNALSPDAPARKDDIRGPVISALADSVYLARTALKGASNVR